MDRAASDRGKSARRAERAIAHWLLAVAALIFLMVVLGGVTRLTQSGLSMVEWQPLVGVLPPLSGAAWQSLFERYQQFPEFQKVNAGMTLAGFKEIFWFEYFHRLLGRLIGIAFAGPFLYFLVRGHIRGVLAAKLVGLLILGGAQGALGWYMVQSGLIDRPDVSPYRLAAHLALATLIYLAALWVAMGLLGRRTRGPHARGGYGIARSFAPVFTGLVFVTMLAGAFVAGNDAGFAYNTFPLMAGQLVPPDLFQHDALWRNFFETVPLVQLDHRLLGSLILLSALGLWFSAGTWRQGALPPEARRALSAVALMALAQFALGLSTLLLVVPVPLAAAHQAGALLLLTFALWSCHALYRAPSSRSAGAGA